MNKFALKYIIHVIKILLLKILLKIYFVSSCYAAETENSKNVKKCMCLQQLFQQESLRITVVKFARVVSRKR